jgi:ABC-2 type transport system permease protein
MSLRSLLKKELHWSKHNILALLLVLLVLPGFFAYTSVAFQTVIPQDVPVAVVPGEENVSTENMLLVEGGLATFAEPVPADSPAEAERMLRRESVYAIVQVPPDIDDPGNANATFVLTVDGSIVPFKEPSKAIRSVMEVQLDRFFDANVNVQRRVIGADNTLPEYLVPIFLMAVIMLFAFTYVPYNLARESAVLDRIRVESSLEAVLGAKLVYFTLLMLVPILVFQGAAAYFGYAVDAVAVGAVLALLLTFAFLAAISMTVMVLLRFGTLGRFVNVVVLLGLLGFSGLAYPVGYFSGLRKELVRAVPTHYSMVVTRSSMQKGLGVAAFGDWLLALAGFALVTLAALKLSAIHYRRSV